MSIKTYLVGGAIRDKLLGLPIKEKDWVVVGATPEDLLVRNYKRVGKDFPVFLHPQTQEEYALARTEKKIAPGYTGFSFNSSATVTLEEDLLRRDLTINAIAEDEHGNLIDPYDGKRDLQNKIFRHVSPAFVEDPVRILRLARFAARFADLGFTIAPETLSLMQDMVAKGEIDALVPERVWQEWHKALCEKQPAMFLQVLRECGALFILFPEINKYYKAALQNLINLDSSNSQLRFAALMQALTIEQIKNICQRFAIPNVYKSLAIIAKKNLGVLKTANNEQTCLQLLENLDAFRRTKNLKNFLSLASAMHYSTEIITIVEQSFFIASKVDGKTLLKQGVFGEALGKAIHKERLQKIKQLVLSNEKIETI